MTCSETHRCHPTLEAQNLVLSVVLAQLLTKGADKRVNSSTLPIDREQRAPRESNWGRTVGRRPLGVLLFPITGIHHNLLAHKKAIVDPVSLQKQAIVDPASLQKQANFPS